MLGLRIERQVGRVVAGRLGMGEEVIEQVGAQRAVRLDPVGEVAARGVQALQLVLDVMPCGLVDLDMKMVHDARALPAR